ncbi:ISAzo13-like element transposase-related protein [Acaryochloris marina NIES-2412]|uniref:ISAzo13-like element transposase-related protein n=1 Tax=Acaryochloris marina TaxID=155978 RepID=UPI0040584AAD
MDCKATVKLSGSSRQGKTRTQAKASEHDIDEGNKYLSCGVLNEEIGGLHIKFGNSCEKDDFIVDNLQNWWNIITPTEQQNIKLISIKVDNGSENSGIYTQFLNRLVTVSDRVGISIQLLCYPLFHSKYNPIERYWGILEQHWHGILLTDVETLLGWASRMTCVVTLTEKTYKRGISLTQKAIRGIEKRVERHLQLPKEDIFIHPI